MKIYQQIASTLSALQSCQGSDAFNPLWETKHGEKLLALVKEHMPGGSGFDSGSRIDVESSTEEKLIFETDFHRMNANGFYDGWTSHKVIVKPSLMPVGITIRVTGRDRNGIKEYIADSFEYALTKVVQP